MSDIAIPRSAEPDAVARARLAELLRGNLPEAWIHFEDSHGQERVGLHNAFARNALRDALGPYEPGGDDPETAHPGQWERDA